MAIPAELDVLFERDITEEVVGDLCTTGTGPYLLTATVTRAVLIPAHVFVLKREAIGPPVVDVFSNVASLQDLDTLQAITPAAGQARYRVDSIQLRFKSLTELEDAATILEANLNRLVNDFNLRAETFVSQETITFPTS